MTKTSGTKEWATSNVNIAQGCSNNCRYCYAKKIAMRFGRKTEDTWKEMQIDKDKVGKSYRKREGRIMFPSSHDITPEILEDAVRVLKKMAEHNSILIVTKPNLKCIQRLCYELQDYKESIEFRFTITSDQQETLDFWEPGAPSFKKRLEALRYATEGCGYYTSVSIEPFLSDPVPLVNRLRHYHVHTIWIGPKNHIQKYGLNEDEERE